MASSSLPVYSAKISSTTAANGGAGFSHLMVLAPACLSPFNPRWEREERVCCVLSETGQELVVSVRASVYCVLVRCPVLRILLVGDSPDSTLLRLCEDLTTVLCETANVTVRSI